MIAVVPRIWAYSLPRLVDEGNQTDLGSNGHSTGVSRNDCSIVCTLDCDDSCEDEREGDDLELRGPESCGDDSTADAD